MSTATKPRKQAIEVLPDALYDSVEAAQYLRLRNPRTVREIPEEVLPRTRVGPTRGEIRFMGRDLLNYAEAGRSKAGEE